MDGTLTNTFPGLDASYSVPAQRPPSMSAQEMQILTATERDTRRVLNAHWNLSEAQKGGSVLATYVLSLTPAQRKALEDGPLNNIGEGLRLLATEFDGERTERVIAAIQKFFAAGPHDRRACSKALEALLDA
jgi:hypothetical protein